MVGLAQGVVGVWGTALRAAAEGVAYCRQHGTPPRGFDHMVTDDHVTKATEGFVQEVEEFQSELGAVLVRTRFERGCVQDNGDDRLVRRRDPAADRNAGQRRARNRGTAGD
jgi:N-formylglutamate amidohydrolase